MVMSVTTQVLRGIYETWTWRLLRVQLSVSKAMHFSNKKLLKRRTPEHVFWKAWNFSINPNIYKKARTWNALNHRGQVRTPHSGHIVFQRLFIVMTIWSTLMTGTTKRHFTMLIRMWIGWHWLQPLSRRLALSFLEESNVRDAIVAAD